MATAGQRVDQHWRPPDTTTSRSGLQGGPAKVRPPPSYILLVTLGT